MSALRVYYVSHQIHAGADNEGRKLYERVDIGKFFARADAEKFVSMPAMRKHRDVAIREETELRIDQHHAHGGEVGRMARTCANDTCFEKVVSGIACKACGVVTY